MKTVAQIAKQIGVSWSTLRPVIVRSSNLLT